ncbi:MAG: RNA polymerase sigma factor [Proteobacteria bacterium]|nr:RNA polymerase sigma factor [Pseudomonadota bacterium]
MLALLPRLRRFAYGLTGSTDEGDDLVQATCERAIDRIETWQPGTRLDSWMYRIARNIFLNWRRAGRVRAEYLQVLNPDGFGSVGFGSVDGARAMEAHLTLASVRQGIARLPEEQRAVLLLVCVEGLAYKEVSELLDLPIGTVTSRLARARLSLKALVEGVARDRPGTRRPGTDRPGTHREEET